MKSKKQNLYHLGDLIEFVHDFTKFRVGQHRTSGHMTQKLDVNSNGDCTLTVYKYIYITYTVQKMLELLESFFFTVNFSL